MLGRQLPVFVPFEPPWKVCLWLCCLFLDLRFCSSYWCNADSQCTVYEKCKDYHCQRCQAGECLNRGSLNPCWNDNQCLLAETCVQGSLFVSLPLSSTLLLGLCQTKQCKTDNQCGYTEVCSPTTQTCVDCTSSMVSGAANAYDPAYYGSSSTSSCKGTGSGYWCYSDSQCPMNEVRALVDVVSYCCE